MKERKKKSTKKKKRRKEDERKGNWRRKLKGKVGGETKVTFSKMNNFTILFAISELIAYNTHMRAHLYIYIYIYMGVAEKT